MLRSKSRSGSVDFGITKNHHSSVFSKTLSASKLCRGDALISQIDSNALVSADRKPSKFSNLSESRINRVLTMQQQMGEIEEELSRTKEQLESAELGKNQALDELKAMKQVAHEANMRANQGLSPEKAAELFEEIKCLKELLSNSQEELKSRNKNIESLKLELEKARELDRKLAERDASFDILKEELHSVKASEARAMEALSDGKKRIQELEAESQERRQSESKLFDSLASQTKQFEQAKIQLEEYRVEVSSLHQKIEELEASSKQNIAPHNNEHVGCTKEEYESLKSELQLAKENLAHAQEAEMTGSVKYRSLLDEMAVLKNELKLATEAEEKSKQAMDDLALALKEVATEANQAKEKLNVTQVELDHVKEEAEQLKEMVRSTEGRYQQLLDEAKKETELHRNTSDRLRLEAEEALLAWNGKEMGFVSCIRRAEEERAVAQHENTKLAESLKAAEHASRTAKEECYKLRDILKQAINEANAAKAAAGIARDENSQLKDCLAEKDEAMHFLTRENERLRINEAAARENVKEFKRLLSTASTELKVEDKEHVGTLSPSDSKNELEEEKTVKKTFSFNLSDLKFMNGDEDADKKVADEDPEKAAALKGSIFDTDASPRSEPETPKSLPHSRRGSSFTEGGETPTSEDFDSLDNNHYDNSDSDSNSQRRRKAIFRRVGDIILRKSFHKREQSTG